jgi:hydroxysqualene dehydroxylase
MERVSSLAFDDSSGGAPVARRLTPEIAAPDAYRAIVTVHFAFDAPTGSRHTARRPRASYGTSGEGDAPAARAGSAVASGGRTVEQRATFAAIPFQERLRAGTRTRWNNFMLAGDWTATGLPATIEGAIRTGCKAADTLMNS